MAASYLPLDKHFEECNRWRNQQINKKFLNSKCAWNWHDYEENECKVTDFDLQDLQCQYAPNLIPVWDCHQCTYRNVERRGHCIVCNAAYSGKSSQNPSTVHLTKQQHAHELTLGDFLTNDHIASITYIPPWICSKCTYYNADGCSHCDICLHPYFEFNTAVNAIPEATNSEEFHHLDAYDCHNNENNEEEDAFLEMEQTAEISAENAAVKTKTNCDPMENNVDTIRLEIAIKLCPNTVYHAKLPKFDRNVEDIAHHTLIECELKCTSKKKNEILSCTKLLPSLLANKRYVALQHKVIVPIQYKYKQHLLYKCPISKFQAIHDEQFSYQYYTRRYTVKYKFNNKPLSSIADLVWQSRYPQLSAQDWKFLENSDDENYYTAVDSCQLLPLLLQYLPLRDVIECIIFQYLAYDQIDIVRMTAEIAMIPELFRKIGVKEHAKKVFHANHDYMPFRVYTNKLSKVRARNTAKFQLLEIGYHKADIFPPKKTHRRTRKKSDGSKRNDGAKQRSKADRKDSKRASLQNRKMEIFYPRQYIQAKVRKLQPWKYTKDGTKKSWRQCRRARKRVIDENKAERQDVYSRLGRWSYSEKLMFERSRKRYVENKWSAYFKLEGYQMLTKRMMADRNVMFSRYALRLHERNTEYLRVKWAKYLGRVWRKKEQRVREKFENEGKGNNDEYQALIAELKRNQNNLNLWMFVCDTDFCKMLLLC